MAHAETRIPAWKRLGLALKNEAQSGVTAPEPTISYSDVQHQAPYDSRNGIQDNGASSIVAAVNGKPSKLGKRKHQHDAAEDDGQTAKRGKNFTIESTTNETIANHSSAPPEVEVAEVQTTIFEPPPDASQPKSGDSNYRKKKDKPKKSKRRNHEDNPVEPAPAPSAANHGSQFLSPDTIAPTKAQRTLLASTETNEQELAPATTPHRHREAGKSIRKESSGSPSAIDRRKSVTFTPDTKKLDGSSGQDLFKNWVSEQKGVYLNFDYVDPGDDPVPVAAAAAAEEEPQKVSLPAEAKNTVKEVVDSAVDTSSSASHKPTTSAAKPTEPGPTATAPTTTKGKKKDPSIYLSYLTQYHTDRPHWKFNKAKQNDVVDNALNIFRVPKKYSEALLEYVQGLKGAGVIERLREKCQSTLKELDEEEAKEAARGDTMDDAAARKAAHDAALQTRIEKEQKRRTTEGDVEDLLEHPHGDGYIRQLRRERAIALLAALGRTAPILPAVAMNGINPMLKNVAPARDSRKRKRRGDISSDESSSDSSSSEESSSSESESENDSDGSDAKPSDSTAHSSRKSDNSDSDSDSDSKSESSEAEDDSSDSEGDSD
jgi:hypothetical protein